MWKKYISILLVIVVLVGATGCSASRESTEQPVAETGKSVEHKEENMLDVYIVSDMVHHVEDGTDTYTTFMSVGEYGGIPVTYGEKGFLFYEALKEYQKEKDVELRVQWFSWPEMMEEELLNQNADAYPDVILSNFTTNKDYTAYMANGLFYDLSSYIEEESLYTEEKYFNQVLGTGKLDEKQYLLPIMFTFDTVMAAEETWKAQGLYLENAQTTEEFVQMLIQAQKKQELQEVVGQFISPVPYYTPYILYSAAGEKWVDRKSKTVNLDKDLFFTIAEFYKNFVIEQYGERQTREELRTRMAETKHVKLQPSTSAEMCVLMEQKGCIIEGGAGGQTYLHAPTAQAWYYENRYQDMQQDYTLAAIPGMDGGTTGHVSYFGGVLSTTDRPEMAYDFLRYLMDEEVEPFFGISVNRELARKQLESLTKLQYGLRRGLQWKVEEGVDLSKNESYYEAKPMTEDTKIKLEQMLETMSTISLPNWTEYEIIKEQLENYVTDEISVEDAYLNAKKQLEEYLNSSGS